MISSWFNSLLFMKKMKRILFCIFFSLQAIAAPRFIPAEPPSEMSKLMNPEALCKTAQETLAYLNKGHAYDPRVIHEGKLFVIPLSRVKATLSFICQHQQELRDPSFVKQHFDFFRWYPDLEQTQKLRSNKPLIANTPRDKILMTKYYVHRAKASSQPTKERPYPLYALPKDEERLSLEAADAKPTLTRFQHGKQAILKGALEHKGVPVLAYLSRDDLEAALMQGTLVAAFGGNHSQEKIFNVNRCNNIPFDKAKNPAQQDRYWYFKQVEGIKGYGKDAEYKITVNSEVTFAADLERFGLGKLLMVQYPDEKGSMVTRAGILADTGGAFQKNGYQVDFLAGSYPNRVAFNQATQRLPDYVTAYFMVLKQS